VQEETTFSKKIILDMGFIIVDKEKITDSNIKASLDMRCYVYCNMCTVHSLSRPERI